jgi:predicted nucleic acid-binding protein
MSYLLDSNVCIEYLRGRNLLVRQRLSAKPLLTPALSIRSATFSLSRRPNLAQSCCPAVQ